jgi:hypothetical protein
LRQAAIRCSREEPAAAAESITMDQVLAAIHALYQSEHNVDNTSRR